MNMRLIHQYDPFSKLLSVVFSRPLYYMLKCIFFCMVEKFESTTKELDRAKAEVKDLHAFIAEKDSESKSDNLKVKLRLLENENMQFRDTCQSLESAVELLNVRLLSLNNIIKIQEAELSKDGIHIVEEKSVKMLSKWRDKVYSLLVQLKSHEILENEDLKNLQNRVCTCISTRFHGYTYKPFIIEDFYYHL